MSHSHSHPHISPNEYAPKHPDSDRYSSGHTHEHAHPHHDWYALGDADAHPTRLVP